MAKSNKGGLGRGLGSLLGGSYEENSPSVQEKPSVSRETSQADLDSTGRLEPVAKRETYTLKSEGIVPEAISIEDVVPVEQEEPLSIEEVVSSKLDEVPLSSIEPNPDQPRTNFKREDLEELASSIEREGLLQPILVRPMANGTYQIIAGERRWQACKLAGIERVPVRLREADDTKALELALIENLQRSDLNPIEEAYGYRRLMERNGMTQAEVAQSMSKGRSTISNALRLLELPEEAQQLLFEDKIQAGHARAILSIPSREGRHKLTSKLKDNKMSVREAEALARLMAGKPTKHLTTREATPASYKAVAKQLRDVLHRNVRVKSSKGKNKIEIEFKDERDLEKLFEELVPSE